MVGSPPSTLSIACPLFAITRAAGRTRLIALLIARDTLSSITARSAGTICPTTFSSRRWHSSASTHAPSSALHPGAEVTVFASRRCLEARRDRVPAAPYICGGT